MEQKVIELLERVFADITITADSSQETVDTWDSMHQLAIAFEIENDFGISLDPEEIIQFKSVKEIVRIVKEKQ